MKDLTTTEGTIAYTLAQNQEAIFKLIEKGLISEAKAQTIKLLDEDPRLKGNPQVPKAKLQMLKAKNQNHFLSIFSAYITGLTVS